MDLNSVGIAFALAISGSAACKANHTTAADPGAGRSASAGAGNEAESPKSPAIPGATVVTLPNMSFPERFAAEANGRPKGIKPTAEDVYAALKAAGLTLVDVKQHLASPQSARYCLGARIVGAKSELLVDASACEYASPEIARKGKDYSESSLKTVIPDRSIYLNKQTTLTLREAQKTPEIDAIAEKAAIAFAKL